MTGDYISPHACAEVRASAAATSLERHSGPCSVPVSTARLPRQQ